MSSSRERGFISGCFTFLIIIALVVGLFIWWGRSKLRDLVYEFTDTSPLAISTLNVTDEQIDNSIAKATAFVTALQNSTEVARIELTGDEINALLAGVHRLIEPHLDQLKDPETGENIELTAEQKQQILAEWRKLPQMLRVEIHGDRIKGKLSIPLNKYIGLGFLGIDEERYLTGKASFNISVEEEKPKIDIDYLEVKGEAIPSEVLDELQNQVNLNKEIEKHTDGSVPIRIKELRVGDGKLAILAMRSYSN